MINPKKLAQYYGRILAVLMPFVGVMFVLALVTERYARQQPWSEMRITPELCLALGRDLLPLALALAGAYVLAVRFVQGVYGLPTFSEGREVLNRLLFGQRAFGPWIRASEGELDDKELEKHVLSRVGGPGSLVVYADTAAVLEKAGRFTQVLTSGFPRLAPFEKVYATVDLRPMHQQYPVEAMSKEGIRVTCEADISYQLDNSGLVPNKDRPFPVEDRTVFKAAMATWIREENRPATQQVMDWSGRVILSETEGNLRSILARYTLDQLVGLVPSQTGAYREEIRQELETALQHAVPKLGARLLKVELGDITVQDEIAQQWLQAWRARWTAWSAERQALGQAMRISRVEDAKTRAQAMMIAQVANTFQQMAQRQQALTSRLILSRLVMVFGQTCSEPFSRVHLPPETMNTLKMLQDMIT